MKTKSKPTREIVRTAVELAARVNATPGRVSQWGNDPEWCKRVKVRGGFDVQAALEWRVEAQKRDLNQVSGALGALRAKRLQQQIQIGELDIEQAKRANELLKIEHDAKRSQWASREQVAELARRFVVALDRMADYVGELTRDATAADKARAQADGLRVELAKWMEGQ